MTPQCQTGRDDARARDALCASDRDAGARHSGLGPRGPAQIDPALCAAEPGPGLRRRWSATGRSCGRRCLSRSQPRSRACCWRWSAASASRSLFNQSRLVEYSLYPLRGDPAGHAGCRDRAAAADLSAAAGRGAVLRLDRRVLSGAREHDARAQLRRPQSRRPVPALRRVALASPARPETAGGFALHARRV